MTCYLLSGEDLLFDAEAMSRVKMIVNRGRSEGIDPRHVLSFGFVSLRNDWSVLELRCWQPSASPNLSFGMSLAAFSLSTLGATIEVDCQNAEGRHFDRHDMNW